MMLGKLLFLVTLSISCGLCEETPKWIKATRADYNAQFGIKTDKKKSTNDAENFIEIDEEYYNTSIFNSVSGKFVSEKPIFMVFVRREHKISQAMRDGF